MSSENAWEKILFGPRAADPVRWQVVNDDVMGGLSTSQFAVTNGVGHFRGRLSLENNGGFASIRTLPQALDCAGSTAFLIRVRGDGRTYKFTARTDKSFDGVNYQRAFESKEGVWEEHRLEMGEFVASWRGRSLPDEPRLTGERLVSIGLLIADKREEAFELEVAWVKVVR